MPVKPENKNADNDGFDAATLFAGGEPIEDDQLPGDRGDAIEPAEQPAPTDAREAQSEAPEVEGETGEEAASETPPADAGEAADAAEEPVAEGPEAKPQPQFIPKSRFDEINERRKHAERRIAELEAAQQRGQDAPPAEAPDLNALERQYMELVVDGEHDKALEVRGRIRAAEAAQYQKLVDESKPQAIEQTKAQLAFETATSELYTRFDTFNPESENYNQDLVDEVLDLHAGFAASGRYSSVQALQKAAELVARENALVDASAPAAPPPAPSERKPDIKKKVAAANAQPPKPAGGHKALDAGKPDIAKLSDEEYDALPETTKARLCGDVL